MATLKKISLKTLNDLELGNVLAQVSEYALTSKGKEKVLNIEPFHDTEDIITELTRTQEFKSSLEAENHIPLRGFESIDKGLGLLSIENSYLEIRELQKIQVLAKTVIDISLFLKKYETYYPSLFQQVEKLVLAPEVGKYIEAKIDRFGEVRSEASSLLAKIRQSAAEIRTCMIQSFNSALTRYHASGFLDEIRETVYDNKRVLAVTATYRKKVKGQPLGSSKSGAIIYMEPTEVHDLNQELQILEFEEREETIRILKELTDVLRPYKEVLNDYQIYLSIMDCCSSKAKYAENIKATMPILTNDSLTYLKEAYHPLLYSANRAENIPTYPQTITLDSNQRIIVISGPNAGGKSITLKTIGLLQLMLQSGLLVPLHERSEMQLFDRILTDIGDNQSIENHLSTYSYRLKNMGYFLKKCDARTLFLIDEFGTGSDPELGGALAEVFLETFYHRGSFGVITTHYANLKILADELPEATNANMQFNEKTLQPTFQLVMGEAGSSFTFEVAQKNNIPYSLINRAKKKVSHGKVRFDETIAKMQRQRQQMEQTSDSLKEKEERAQNQEARWEELNTKLKDKLERYQELYDQQQRFILLGKKVNQLINRYSEDAKKRVLVSEFIRLAEVESSKKSKSNSLTKPLKEKQIEESEKELQKELVHVQRQKRQKKKTAINDIEIKRPTLKVGDKVRLPEGKAVGNIESIEKKKALVNYGVFTTRVNIDQLELVESSSQ